MLNLWFRLCFRVFPPRRVRSILLNVMLPIGDTLFTTPTIRALRQHYPEAHIVALAFPTNAGILRGNPDIDEIVLHPTGQTFTIPNYILFFLKMQRRHFTMAVEFRPYSWWLSVLCGVLRRLELSFPEYQWFFPIGGRPWKDRHAVESYATAVAPLGIRVDTGSLVAPVLQEARASLAAFLTHEGVEHDERLIALHPGGEGFRGMKRWETARFATLGDRLAAFYGARVVIVGGRDELTLAYEVSDAMARSPLVTNGRVSLSETTALLERCILFVGDDSAPLHIAAALGTPTVGVFGPTGVVNYKPLGPYVEVARSGLVCSPCFHFVGSQPVWASSHCRVPTCLHALGVGDVLEAARRAYNHKYVSVGD